MNQNAQDLMMNAPSEVNENQLKELNISIKAKALTCDLQAILAGLVA